MTRNKASKVVTAVIFFCCALIAVLVLKAASMGIVEAQGRLTNVRGTFTTSSGKVKAAETIKVFIGENRFTLFGYTSPHAHVTLEGHGVFDETFADATGYFIFKNRFSPVSSREVCLISRDTQGRISLPQCLPPFPQSKNVVIGPVILSPSLSLNKSLFTRNDRAVLEGMSIPSTAVNVSFFGENSEEIDITANTDADGNFSVNFPTDHPQQMRAFATTDYKNQPSGISNTITIDVLPWWKILLTSLGLLIGYILKNILTYVFILELLVLWLLIWLKRRRHLYPLALRPDHDLMELTN